MPLSKIRSQSINLADTFAFAKGTVTGTDGGFTFPANQSLNGQSSVNFTGIPSGTNIIKFSIYRASGSTTGYPAIQIGDSGGIEASGYISKIHFQDLAER